MIALSEVFVVLKGGRRMSLRRSFPDTLKGAEQLLYIASPFIKHYSAIGDVQDVLDQAADVIRQDIIAGLEKLARRRRSYVDRMLPKTYVVRMAYFEQHVYGGVPDKLLDDVLFGREVAPMAFCDMFGPEPPITVPGGTMMTVKATYGGGLYGLTLWGAGAAKCAIDCIGSTPGYYVTTHIDGIGQVGHVNVSTENWQEEAVRVLNMFWNECVFGKTHSAAKMPVHDILIDTRPDSCMRQVRAFVLWMMEEGFVFVDPPTNPSTVGEWLDENDLFAAFITQYMHDGDLVLEGVEMITCERSSAPPRARHFSDMSCYILNTLKPFAGLMGGYLQSTFMRESGYVSVGRIGSAELKEVHFATSKYDPMWMLLEGVAVPCERAILGTGLLNGVCFKFKSDWRESVDRVHGIAARALLATPTDCASFVNALQLAITLEEVCYGRARLLKETVALIQQTDSALNFLRDRYGMTGEPSHIEVLATVSIGAKHDRMWLRDLDVDYSCQGRVDGMHELRIDVTWMDELGGNTQRIKAFPRVVGFRGQSGDASTMAHNVALNMTLAMRAQ